MRHKLISFGLALSLSSLAACAGAAKSEAINHCIEPELLKQQMVAAVNIARSQARFCGTEFYDAATAVTWSYKLEKMAYNHTADMESNNFFDHVGSDSSTIATRAQDVGYDYSHINENIAAGYQTVNTVVDGWLNSPGHCRNIMNATVTELGASCLTSTQSDFNNYWTQNLGNPR